MMSLAWNLELSGYRDAFLRRCRARDCCSRAYAVASAPTRERVRLGMRGLKRERALASATAAWAHVEPLVRWLGVRVSGSSPTRSAGRLD